MTKATSEVPANIQLCSSPFKYACTTCLRHSKFFSLSPANLLFTGRVNLTYILTTRKPDSGPKGIIIRLSETETCSRHSSK